MKLGQLHEDMSRTTTIYYRDRPLAKITDPITYTRAQADINEVIGGNGTLPAIYTLNYPNDIRIEIEWGINTDEGVNQGRQYWMPIPGGVQDGMGLIVLNAQRNNVTIGQIVEALPKDQLISRITEITGSSEEEVGPLVRARIPIYGYEIDGIPEYLYINLNWILNAKPGGL